MRAIDADRLLTDRMKSKYYHLPNGDIAIPIIDIEHAPTIELQPQRIGQWELIDDTEFRVPGYRCSVCHCECEDWDKKPTYRFCPNCGARMEGEK